MSLTDTYRRPFRELHFLAPRQTVTIWCSMYSG